MTYLPASGVIPNYTGVIPGVAYFQVDNEDYIGTNKETNETKIYDYNTALNLQEEQPDNFEWNRKLPPRNL